MTRTDLASATIQVIKAIQNGDEYTLNKLSDKTELNFRTVQKILRLLEECQKQLETKKISITHLNNSTHIQMKPKSGMTSMPLPIQKMLVRTTYYPTPNREQELLAYLLQKNATSVATAIEMNPGKILSEMVDAQHIKKKGEKYYLTEIGIVVAKGSLSMYPELVLK